ncbi:uncharacterized protein LOC132174357 [Corylus avellana]|uniref:uncharacterized protein LOC132174357 n=1 Tax=Corylus avellana TaxID=13451 RepID=UPI00286A7BCA|nr:uncharacterized protein LOC132174357 [Corylus avellana]
MVQISANFIGLQYATVSELINGDTKWWDSTLLETIFTKEEVHLIQSLPVSHFNREDVRVWRGTNTGLFSVRSAYYIQMETDAQGVAASSSLEDPLCPLCGRAPETVSHILWRCPSAKDAWSVGRVKLQKKSSTTGQNFLQIVEEVFVQCDEEEIQQSVGIARRLWLRRNEVVHCGTLTHPNLLVQRTITAVEDFATANGVGDTQNSSSNALVQEVQWRAPCSGWIKANWDASLAKEKGWMGLGVVVPDDRGMVLAAHSRTLE